MMGVPQCSKSSRFDPILHWPDISHQDSIGCSIPHRHARPTHLLLRLGTTRVRSYDLRTARTERASCGINMSFADAPVLEREASPSVVAEALGMDLLILIKMGGISYR